MVSTEFGQIHTNLSNEKYSSHCAPLDNEHILTLLWFKCNLKSYDSGLTFRLAPLLSVLSQVVERWSKDQPWRTHETHIRVETLGPASQLFCCIYFKPELRQAKSKTMYVWDNSSAGSFILVFAGSALEFLQILAPPILGFSEPFQTKQVCYISQSNGTYSIFQK